MLTVTGLTSAYGRVCALRDVTLEVHDGEIVALLGSNGAGKTTLLRAISGVQPIRSGQILFDGAAIERERPHHRVARGLIQVPEGRQVFGTLSVEDNLRLGAYRRGSANGSDPLERVYAMFPVLRSRRHSPAADLSGGQQQMLAVGRLKLGQGEVFHGEGILAVTKALLQSGCQLCRRLSGRAGLASARRDGAGQGLSGRTRRACRGLHQRGVGRGHAGASIMYPVRGAVTWKSIVGTNVARRAVQPASPGVIGGALIVVGEDYGEGASVIQERTHAFAMKSALWLMDPGRTCPAIVRCVEKSFELSEASNTPVMLESAHPRLPCAGQLRGQGQCRAGDLDARPLDEPAPSTTTASPIRRSTYGP
jgi:ABC-type uncharacterized transport system ATPase subunit